MILYLSSVPDSPDFFFFFFFPLFFFFFLFVRKSQPVNRMDLSWLANTLTQTRPSLHSCLLILSQALYAHCNGWHYTVSVPCLFTPLCSIIEWFNSGAMGCKYAVSELFCIYFCFLLNDLNQMVLFVYLSSVCHLLPQNTNLLLSVSFMNVCLGNVTQKPHFFHTPNRNFINIIKLVNS